METISFEFVTKPLTVNQSQDVTIRGGKGVIIKSKKGRDYIRDIEQELMYQRQSLPFCFYSVVIWLPGKYRFDVGNCAKPLVDILVKNRIPDDAFSMYEATKYYTGNTTKVVITENDFEESLSTRQYSPATIKKYRKMRNG